MIKNLKIIIAILIISILIISSYFFISSLINNQKFSNLKLLLNNEQKELIKKYIFPYKVISLQQQTISQKQQTISHQLRLLNIIGLSVIELEKKKEGSEITTSENIKKLSINKTLKKIQLKLWILCWNK